ncbi:MAG: gamma-glutamyltransferase family protein [Chloroflexi bacterium]|nr:gamma-glutamyltransferase family protein [Chloroflexota bacterium]
MALGLRTYRPLIAGRTHMAAAGHYLATAAAYRILEQGGNASDAGVAAGIALNVTLPQYTSFGGVAPVMIHDAARGETVTIAGLGRWPKAASVDYFEANHGGQLPGGVLRTVTPSAADAWLSAIQLYGTMTFEQVVTPALELAENGFPIPQSLHRALAREEEKFANGSRDPRIWGTTLDTFFPGGKALGAGEVAVQKELANTFRRLVSVERGASGKGRVMAIQAARDLFYRGDMAHKMVEFNRAQGGLLSLDDMGEFEAKLEPPTSIDYKGIDVFTCGPWCQGPTTIQALGILSGFDLKGMGHNSPDYLHTLIESLKLAFADRHSYYGDPDFVDVPMKGLLDPDYAAQRRQQIDPSRACPDMPRAGDPWAYQGYGSQNGRRANPAHPEPVAGAVEPDTSYVCVVDRWGNGFSATPSDGFSSAAAVPGLGFAMSTRGYQTWLDRDHPACLMPGKRPRLTPNPAMAFRDGKLWMPFGTPGGDVQCQSMTQLFLNVAEFGMDVQQAIEQPRVASWSFPDSGFPHNYTPGAMSAEGRIDPETIKELERRGHKVDVWDDWTPRMGALNAITIDRQRETLEVGADLRRDNYAMGR